MLIKSLSLTNFRQFIGTQNIEFSTDKTKNVTVLIGRNTSGKTTFIRAFEWILYNQNNFSDKILLNYNVVDNMTKGEQQTVVGILTIEHEGKEYEIRREVTYVCTGRGTVSREIGRETKIFEANIVSETRKKAEIYYLQQDGQTKTRIESEVQSNIERILPEALSKYFFFGGERIGSISNKEDIESSVKGLMGLDVLSNAMKHLRSIIGSFKKEMDYSGNETAQKIKNNLDSRIKQLQTAEEELKTVQEQIDFYQQEKEKYSALLKANQEVADDQKKREQLEGVIKSLNNRIKNDKDDLVTNFSRDAFAYFGMPLIKKAIEMLDNAEDITESVPDMNANSIDYIINHRKVCICGTTITEGSAAHKNLLAERAKLPPESIGSLVRSYRERAMEYLSFAENYHSKIDKKYKDLRADQREAGFRKEEFETLSEKLSGKKDIKDIELNYKNADSRYKSLERDKENLILSIGGYRKDIDNFEKSLNSYTKANEKNAKVAACIDYSTAVFDWIKNSYQAKEEIVRSSLEQEVNAKFSRMYHGKRTIIIDEKYRAKYLDITTEESDGLKAVKSFAFIAGLVELAKKALGDKDDADADIGPHYYPLVMDAPFSNLDEIHIENICNEIPAVAEQVIIAVMQKDWGYAEETIATYVGCSYDILKDTAPNGSTIETMTHIARREN